MVGVFLFNALLAVAVFVLVILAVYVIARVATLGVLKSIRTISKMKESKNGI